MKNSACWNMSADCMEAKSLGFSLREMLDIED